MFVIRRPPAGKKKNEKKKGCWNSKNSDVSLVGVIPVRDVKA